MSTKTVLSDVRDLKLADMGVMRIQWAATQMPVLELIRESPCCGKQLTKHAGALAPNERLMECEPNLSARTAPQARRRLGGRHLSHEKGEHGEIGRAHV